MVEREDLQYINIYNDRSCSFSAISLIIIFYQQNLYLCQQVADGLK